MVGLMLAASLFATNAVAQARYVRDWAVERPFSAGLMKGMTVGLFPRTGYGEGGREASAYDPYGLSPLVHEEVARLGAPQYRLGVSLGLGVWIFALGGVLHRRLTTLTLSRLEKRDAG